MNKHIDKMEFVTFQLDLEDSFSNAMVEMEECCPGRQCAIVSDTHIVRSTNISRKIQPLTPYYKLIIDKIIAKLTSLGYKSVLPQIEFNNAMVEQYDNRYRRMGYHTDQMLDLVPGSWIVIFSAYAGDKARRTLRTKHKITGVETDYIMEHNSCIAFQLHTNISYLHKIIAPANAETWLGITFRHSKTLIGSIKRLATEEERKKFYQLKALENRNAMVWPDLDYTISPGDLN